MRAHYQYLISQYIKAKDQSRPHLMARVFSNNATLSMQVQTDAISFPAAVSGVDKITDTLVRDFNQKWNNIYTLCLIDSVNVGMQALDCRWLVGMTDKITGQCRVGFGEYHWRFSADVCPQVEQLTIVIDDMVVLESGEAAIVLSWLDNQDYPWVASAALHETMPRLDGLQGVVQWYDAYQQY